VQWAQTGLSDAEKSAYNDAVKSGNVACREARSRGHVCEVSADLRSRSEAHRPVVHRPPAPEAFTSWAQVTKAKVVQAKRDEMMQAELERYMAHAIGHKPKSRMYAHDDARPVKRKEAPDLFTQAGGFMSIAGMAICEILNPQNSVVFLSPHMSPTDI